MDVVLGVRDEFIADAWSLGASKKGGTMEARVVTKRGIGSTMLLPLPANGGRWPMLFFTAADQSALVHVARVQYGASLLPHADGAPATPPPALVQPPPGAPPKTPKTPMTHCSSRRRRIEPAETDEKAQGHTRAHL
mmetsp:Transcript_2130/g.7792  ORF Transcript_2130/g.7792 Transcript_2130/m.7792 type:complete len:136 (+) Transcript_2130:632-1039(+)